MIFLFSRKISNLIRVKNFPKLKFKQKPGDRADSY